MQKLSHYVAEFLAEAGCEHVFMLTGGGAMHLNDSFGSHAKLQKIYNHHEQASAMAAESYARLTRKIPIVNVTTGPGGINTLNGVFGAWVDSLPMLIVSGQVRYDTCVGSTDLPLRQLGDQECNIVEMVKSITKYAVMISDPNTIKFELQKALWLIKNGRCGPVWIDIPMNVQGAMIDPAILKSFTPEEDELFELDPKVSEEQIKNLINRINKAERPVILAGSGVRLSGSHAQFLELIDALKIPVTTAWNSHDALYDDHPLHCGKPGSIGDRAGNFTVQNADLLIVLGCRLNIRQVSYNFASFARNAHIVMVDIDKAELAKPTLKIDEPLHVDLADFIPALLAAANSNSMNDKNEWVAWCKERKNKYPVVLPEYWKNEKSVNPYCFMQRLSQHLPENQIIVTGDGTACVASFQAMHLKPGQRLYTNSGCASMGYDLPGAIGACVGSEGKTVVCLAGDGSIMQNIQELATIQFNQYPIKIFILNNNGYHSIRQTQQNFFGEPLVGVGPDSGLGFPDFSKLAVGFGLPFVRCHVHDELDSSIEEVMKIQGPVICEIMLDLQQQFSPKLSSRRLEDGRMVTSPLEDMTPFLSREELAENMLIETETC
ncbi:MAG: thiamine pyrophosphate-binding protein [Gammaproteobacteria bacterium]|nr:thiamine pyrophosphate-binding protein [Gammaproteobacteria bacterium]